MGTISASPYSRGRVEAFDWLRGVAVLVMIQCHALVLLRPDMRATLAYRLMDFVDGLVAPSFVFAAGFSLALVQVRDAAAGKRRSRWLKTLRRIAEVLLIASLVNGMWFPILKEPKWLLRIDILHCIGLGLLSALPILVSMSKRPALLQWIFLGFAAAAFGAAPWAESVRGPIANYVNVSSGSVFPLVPWAGYLYLGASVGVVAASGDPRAVARWLLWVMGLGAVAWRAAPLFVRMYPPHAFWITDPANHGRRWAMVCALVLGLMLLEKLRAGKPRGFFFGRIVEAFAMSSLAAYFIHQALLYYEVFGFSFFRWWGERCGWGTYGMLTLALIGATFTGVLITDRLYSWASWARIHLLSGFSRGAARG